MTATESFQSLVTEIGKRARAASHELAVLETATKNNLLVEMANRLREVSPQILAANNEDVTAAQGKNLSQAMIDRLTLNDKRIEEMAKGLEEVAVLPDPVGQVTREWTRPNRLKVARLRIPLGVIAIIYEARPNVTVDAAGLCLKSGNAVILRGSALAHRSNKILATIMREVLQKHGVTKDAVQVVPVTDREAMIHLMQLTEFVDVIIPRGGEGLMRFINEHARVPVIKHDKGVCNLYVDDAADLAMAATIVLNAKVQRPGVCNALENLCVEQKIAATFLPRIVRELRAAGVEVRGDEASQKIIPDLVPATEEDWSTEYLDLILSVKVVADIKEACDFIRRYGSQHTEAIVTQDEGHADYFIKNINSSCVLVNASTRFNDGGQLGLGAEIGISTTKLHAFGPMGLEELTTQKFVVRGQGQIRS